MTYVQSEPGFVAPLADAPSTSSRPKTSSRPVRHPILAVALLVVAAACTAERSPVPESATEISWTERVLPTHPGPAGRTVVRDAIQCGGAWWVVGAVFLDEPTETQDTRPAAWRSVDDTHTWAPVDLVTHTYWGRRAILNSAACSRGRIAVVG